MAIRQQKLDAALRDCGAVLIRANKHRVYRLPNGRNFVASVSPSDTNGERNAMRDLRRALSQGAAQ